MNDVLNLVVINVDRERAAMDLTKRVWCVAGDKVHTFVSGCVPGQVAGTHILNEARIGGLAGEDLACLPACRPLAENTALCMHTGRKDACTCVRMAVDRHTAVEAPLATHTQQQRASSILFFSAHDVVAVEHLILCASSSTPCHHLP